MSENLDPSLRNASPDHAKPEQKSGHEPWRTLFIVTGLLLVVGLVVVGLSQTVFKAEAAPAPTPSHTHSDDIKPAPDKDSATACSPENVKVTLGERSGAAGSSVIPLVFTNFSSEPCSMKGYPTVAFVGHENGAQIGEAAGHDTTVAPRHFTLAPGGGAGSMVTIVDASDVCTSPVPADGLRAVLPGATGAFYVPIKDLEACTTGQSLLTVTPIAGP